jgi:hypothetical protein
LFAREFRDLGFVGLKDFISNEIGKLRVEFGNEFRNIHDQLKDVQGQFKDVLKEINASELRMKASQTDFMKQTYIIARIFIIAIVVATVLNGSSFWLKRVGWLEPQLYQTYKKSFRDPDIERSFEDFKQLTRSAYQTEGVWKAFKVSKDVIFLLFIFISLLLIFRGDAGWRMRYGWLFISMAFLFLYAFFISLFQFGLLLPLAGLRSFLFLIVAIVGSWAVRDEMLYFLAKCLMWLILFQLLLAPYEFMFGMQFFRSGYLLNRIVGTMLQPGSFGIVLVLGLIWCFAFFHTRTWLWWLAAIVFILILLSGSATALLLLLFAFTAAFWTKMSQRYRKWLIYGGIAGGIVMFYLLPLLTGRFDVHNSLWGRLSLFKEHTFTGSEWYELLFGRGLGAGTNTAVNLLMDWQASTAHGAGSHTVFVADSTPLMLISQIGFIGFFLVYGLLFLAVRNDLQARIFYVSIILASLTVNITELFPVNFILGLLLARSFSIAYNR